MLTIFTVPKPFIGKFNAIQRNALQSWALLNPKPEIILFDKVEGTETVVKDLGIQNIPDISYNEFGTPLVNSIFKKARSIVKNDLLAYVNTDTILTDSIFSAVETAGKYILGNEFLIIGKRWSIYLDRPFNFKKGDWQDGLKNFREYNGNGFMGHAGQIDYLIFPREIEWNIPPFATESGVWDGWFIYNALNLGIPVIDASNFITAYHQEHFNFDLVPENKQDAKTERKNNLKLRGGFSCQNTILDSTHLLTYQGLEKTSAFRKFSSKFLKIKMLFE
ncbi:MAG: hypothetical protein PHX78_04035 [bacterium]|nr:hypothetical protein [bacterium]